MKTKVSIAVITLCMLISVPANAASKFWKKVGKFLGNVAEAAVVVAADRVVEKYAPEAAAQYRESMEQLNQREQQRVAEVNAAEEEYKQERIRELKKELIYYRGDSEYDKEMTEKIKQEISELESGSVSETHYNTSLVGSMLSDCGMNQRNIDRGMAWNDAQNKYEKRNVAKDYLFDAAGEFIGQTELIEKFRQISNVQNTYLSENAKALTEEEKQAALDKRNLAYFDIGYDTYQEAKTRKSQHLAEKLNIAGKLMQSGQYENTDLACEIAANIISIQKSNLPEDEKAALIQSYGLDTDVKEIQQLSSEVIAMDESALQAEEARRAAEEAKRQEELRRLEEERRLKAERDSALALVANTKTEAYPFDKVDLSNAQKSELDTIASILNKYQDVKITIIGHTCKIGYKNINLKKGLKRAQAAQDYLLEKGVNAEQISIESKGELEPLVENNSPKNRAQNRRIEFIVVE